MKHSITCLLIFSTLTAMGQGFPATPVAWPVPDGGRVAFDGTECGFYEPTSSEFSSIDGNQWWTFRDMNGDGLTDLVATHERVAGVEQAFVTGPLTHWNVFLNNGSGFDDQAIVWTLPEGVTSTTMEDMDGDGKPDLVVCAEMVDDVSVSFNPNNNAYWKVFLNTGTGFSAEEIQWAVPDGGRMSDGVDNGFMILFNYLSNPLLEDGSDAWYTFDMDGDGRKDLVVTGEWNSDAESYMGFDPNASGYWKVHLNNGSGFEPVHQEWPVPDGGALNGSTAPGFYYFSNPTSAGTVGSEYWGVRDLNGDGLADLVVTAIESGDQNIVPTNGTNNYWKVFLSTGTGFAQQPIEWALPTGGLIEDAVEIGYNAFSKSPGGMYDVGSEWWFTADMDGDGQNDLMVMSTLTDYSPYTSAPFGPANAQYWEMYPGTGSGFSPTAMVWSIPDGGQVIDGVSQGYVAQNVRPLSTANDEGSEAWVVLDLDDSGTLDLIVTSRELPANYFSTYGEIGSWHWNAFLNPNFVGISEQDRSAEALSLRPNPTYGPLTIGIGRDRIGSVEVHDVRGHLLLQQRATALDLTGFPSGLYLITAHDEHGGRHHGRVVKN